MGTQYCSILLSVNLQIISKTSNKMADTEPTPVEEVQVEPVENKEAAEATTEETEATSTEAAGEETPAATEGLRLNLLPLKLKQSQKKLLQKRLQLSSILTFNFYLKWHL